MTTPLEALRAKNLGSIQSSKTPLELLRESQKTSGDLTPLQQLRQVQPPPQTMFGKVKGFFTRQDNKPVPVEAPPRAPTPLELLRSKNVVEKQATTPTVETDYKKSKGYSQLWGNEIQSGRAKLQKNPETGQNEFTSPRLERWKTATEVERGKIIEEQFDESLLGRALQSEKGKKITGRVNEKVENLPLKTFARIQSIGSKTYNEAYEKLKLAKGDVNNSGFQTLMYESQDAIGKVIVGVGLNFIPVAGKALSRSYWAGLSVEGQRDEEGGLKSTVVGNTVIDVIGDSILGDSLGKLLGKPASGIKNIILKTVVAGGKSALVEGSTEVTQRFLTFGNEYKSARTDEERQEIIDQVKNYVKSGEMAMEFGVGAIAGGAIGGPSALIINKRLPNVQSDTATKNIMEDVPPPGTDGSPALVETTPTDSPLTTDPRNFKSAEEFVKAQKGKYEPPTDFFSRREKSLMEAPLTHIDDIDTNKLVDVLQNKGLQKSKADEIRNILNNKEIKNITVFRASAGDKLLPGDYVALTREYAESYQPRGGDRKIIEQQISKNDLYFNYEAGDMVYSPDGVRSLTDIWNKAQETATLKQTPIDQKIFDRIVKTAEETDTNLKGKKGTILAELDFKRDTKIAMEQVENDFDSSLAMVRGEVSTPIQIKTPLLIEAIAQKAVKDSNFDLASEMILRRQMLGSQAGSDLKAHDVQVGFTDPITALEVVIKKQTNRRIKGRKVADVKKDMDKEFDKKVKKAEITQDEIVDFINEIEC